MSKRLTARVGSGVAIGLMVVLSMGQGPEQNAAKDSKPLPKVIPYTGISKPSAVMEAIKPLPLEPIPDEPPPHEGVMFRYSYRIEPPDLVTIELLEALPGRPLTGEHLVRPDGKVSLGFYGEVHVAGLTVPQAKTKIIHHMRHFLTDQSLGLVTFRLGSAEELMPILPPPGTTVGRIKGPDSLDREEAPEPKDPDVTKDPQAPVSSKPGPTVRLDKKDSDNDKLGDLRIATRVRKQTNEVGPKPAKKLPKPPRAKAKAGAVSQKGPKPAISSSTRKPAEKPEPKTEVEPKMKPGRQPPADGGEGHYIVVAPEDSSAVLVDVASYNSGVYYILGDLSSPGRLPATGGETVLDAIQYGGGLTLSADPKKIVLHRPARAGKPLREYKIDLDAIHRGEKTANLQVFPGDRLIVGRKAESNMVETTPKK